MTITDSIQESAAAFEARCDDITSFIDRSLTDELNRVELAENLRAAVKYAVLGGGKRLRPLLTILSCEAVGVNRKVALFPAVALELIHNFSLVHDDLPAMDDDKLRRGQPTLHIHSGEAMAILAGDVMVSLAFSFISKTPLDSKRIANLSRELADATTHMISGQVYDTLGGFDPDMRDTGRLELIHQHKTAALITVACRMGGICGNASADQLDALTTFGCSIGLMFQIVDDLIDVTQSTEHTGKATGKDEQAGKLTYPGLLGIEASKKEIVRLKNEAIAAIKSLGKRAQPLRDLCEVMSVRTK